MKKIITILILVFMASGCATVKTSTKTIEQKTSPAAKSSEVQSKIIQEDNVAKDVSQELQNIEEEQLDEYVETKGVIFAKTDFQGVLKANYVRLLFEDKENIENRFELLIGGDEASGNFPWDVKTVEPGYFYIELPSGSYKISSISIPVGSSLAEEPSAIYVEVIPNVVTYAGTLKINGTKEKIRLGGVPVIKPGFEYEVEVIDQWQEGVDIFRERYPGFSGEVMVNLMKVGSTDQ